MRPDVWCGIRQYATCERRCTLAHCESLDTLGANAYLSDTALTQTTSILWYLREQAKSSGKAVLGCDQRRGDPDHAAACGARAGEVRKCWLQTSRQGVEPKRLRPCARSSSEYRRR